MAYCYVSYAHGDDESYVKKFLHDLGANRPQGDETSHIPGHRHFLGACLA